ncbi:MAG: methyltransferase domain-containing protein [Rhizobiales bacterium]|nr:methyltransferase domain-containing protein [Hyphomicrobiales bacterium]
MPETSEKVATAACPEGDEITLTPAQDILEQVRAFEGYLSGTELNEYDRTHQVRLIETFRRIAHLVRPGLSVVELGGMSRIANYFGDSCGMAVRDYTDDLRDPIKLDSAAFDIVLMLEVLEHLNDRHTPASPITEIAMYTGSGAISCLQEANRILRPGGYLVLTTPNAASVDTLGRTLLKMHPFQYEPHVREYAPADVKYLAKLAGFHIQAATTFFSWNELPGYRREVLLKAIGDLGYDTADRGDDAFYLLSKLA